MIIHNIDQHSEAWHEIRCGRITGTRFKSLVAKESTDTYKGLLIDLATEIITGRAEESYSNANMEKGLEMEPVARQAYEEFTENKVKTAGFISPDEDTQYSDWLGISPDGLIEGGMIEIKCPMMKTHMGYILDDKLPTEYRYQVQGQLFVTGLPFCDFVSYVEGMKLFIVRAEPDLELFKVFEERISKAVKEVSELLIKYNNYE